MDRKSIISYIICILTSLVSYGEEHHFYASYSNAEGLVGMHVRSCSQDAYGRIWVGSGNGVYYYDGTRFRPLDDYDYMQHCTKMTFAVQCDTEGRTWIASSNGAGYYDTNTGKFTPVEGFNSEPARDLDIDGHGRIWITSRSGIWRYDFALKSAVNALGPLGCHPEMSVFDSSEDFLYILSSEGSIIRHELSTGLNYEIYPQEEGKGAVCICASDNGHIIIALENGVILRMNTQSRHLHRIPGLHRMANVSAINSMLEIDSKLWIGTASGLLIYDKETRTLEDQTGTDEKQYLMTGQTVRELFEDREGNVWVGTANGGLKAWMSYGGHFSRFVSGIGNDSLAGTSIRAICQDRKGYIWTGSEEGQVSRLDPVSGEFKDFSQQTGISYGTVITSIKEIDGMLWIATYGDGLYKFDPVTGRTILKCEGETSRFFALTIDHNGSIRAGTDIGVFSVDKETGELMTENPTLGFPVHTLEEDAFGRIWMGTYGKGVGYWEPGTAEYIPIPYTDTGYNPLSSNYINYLYKDSAGNMWVCSEGSGIARVRFTSTGEIEGTDLLNRESGLPSNDIKSAFESPGGRIWAMTSDGMAEIGQNDLEVRRVYMQSDAVLGKFFDPGASLVTVGGRAYAGTGKGLLTFTPDIMEDLFRRKPVHINGILAGTAGKMVQDNGEGSGASGRNGLRIRWKDAPMLTVTYASYDYADPNSKQFDCELRRAGFTSNITTGDFSASYAGLRPGHYTFTVSPAGSKDAGVSDSIRFFIIPPWYRSVAAKILYLIALALGIALIVRRTRMERERVARFKEAQSNMQALHSQMGFLTNVTHEIRTPVTMMTILMDRIIKKSAKEPDDDLTSMKSNMNRLLELCDQMLDYRKVENDQIKLHPDDEALNDIVRAAVESFRPAAEARGMGFVVSLPPGQIIARCDRNAVDSILGNLLSNAVKYGSSRINIELDKSEKEAVIYVESDGEHIPKDESELIFNAFYQSDPKRSTGTGIGLTYSRALANMQNGTLFLDDKTDDMNRFVLTLPLSILGGTSPVQPTAPSSDKAEEAETIGDGQPLILVVEDNEGLRNVIQEELSNEYRTIGASNGAEALDIIKKENVDLVVSDIMMPVMDGCELCNAIKTDLHTSHIEVILLTAAIGTDNHIKSLKAGADGYLEKPFRVELLRENIRNLFRNREIRNEQFATSPLSHFRCASYSSVEQDFMDSLNEYVNSHISDSEMPAEKIAEALRTTRKTVAHKIKANTGLTVNEYVRTCRLKKAAELLAKQKYRINEVCYLVGYSTPSYFTKHFTAQFGMNPSEFIHTL